MVRLKKQASYSQEQFKKMLRIKYFKYLAKIEDR